MTPAQVAGAVARAFADAVRETLARRPRFACAVPGGSVATTVFPALATLDLPWDAIDIVLADERFVPASAPDSNARAVREHWLSSMRGARPTLHEMSVDGDPDQAAAAAATRLLAIAGTPPRLDLALLGVGPDGHVASLFPDRHDWLTRPEWVIAVRDAPKPPPTRLSLGLPALAAARAIWFVAFGDEKAAAIAAARHDPDSVLPAAIVARAHAAVRWFLDDGAAGRG